MVRRSRGGNAFVLLVAMALVMAVLPALALAEPDATATEGMQDNTFANSAEAVDEPVGIEDLWLEAQATGPNETSDLPADGPSQAGEEDYTDVQAVGLTEMGEQGITVSVTKTEIIVKVNGLAGSGSAVLRAFAANEYPVGDDTHGYSSSTSSIGHFISDYVCGSSQMYTFARFAPDGYDRLYDKYYVMQGDNILGGPVYATEIESARNVPPFEVASKKGLIHEGPTSVAASIDMGTSNTVINMDLGSLIYRNEDSNGNQIDNSLLQNVYTFVSNGETFYFDAGYVNAMDADIASYSRRGINVMLVLITWANTSFDRYPTQLAYNTTDNHQTVAFNTSNSRGLRYWVAALEFLADRYSKSADGGLVEKYIIGNEVDYCYDWYLIQPETDGNGHMLRADLDVFMEEYSRAMRLANLAVKKYNSGAKVAISITHNWAESRGESFKSGPQTNTQYFYNSYAPKKMLDWMLEKEKDRGDYDWSISAHPYPVGTTSTNPIKTDTNYNGDLKNVTGDWHTSPWITCTNLELYQLYLDRPEARYNGELREVSLTETSICSEDRAKVSMGAYAQSLHEQAATIAQYYYRAACVDCITEITYFKEHDIETSYKLGLMEIDSTRKPSYDVWKYVDTNLSYLYTNRYLSAISSAGSYRAAIDTTHSGFDWAHQWSDSKIMRRNVQDESKSVYRVAGNSRFETSIKTADLLKTQLGVDRFDAVIVASGANFADALSGSYLASKKKAPILLVNTSQSFSVAMMSDYIANNLASNGTIYVLGGNVAIGSSFENALPPSLRHNVKRLAGSDRLDTNRLILEEAGVAGEDILIATGWNSADSLSASASARPILMVGGSLTADQKSFVSAHGSNHYYVLGGPNAVSESVISNVKSCNVAKVERVAGEDRYDTSVRIARLFYDRPQVAVIAYGHDFPDGLCGGPLATAIGAPLVLTRSDASLMAYAETYCVGCGIKNGYVLGGEGNPGRQLVTNEAVQQILGSNPTTI